MACFICIVFVLGALPVLGHIELPERARGGKIWAAQLAAETSSWHVGNTTENFFSQLVDHNNSAAGTFKQRYYFDTSFWNGSASSPIFYYIGGEGALRGTPTGYVATLAQEFGAFIVALEHRWYGSSLPGDLRSTIALQTTPKVEQAIADLAAFQQWMTLQLGTSSPWLAIGGSYPGALSAWYRESYPALAAAAWSSSGVVNAVFNYTNFDVQV